MSKKGKKFLLFSIFILIFFISQFVFALYHTVDYSKRVKSGNERWLQVEDRIVDVESRLDTIEARVEKIEKEL